MNHSEAQKLQITYGFGANTTIKDSVAHLTDTEVLFVYGRQLIVQNVYTQKLRIFPSIKSQQQSSTEFPVLGEITAIGICSKRQHLVVSRRTNKFSDPLDGRSLLCIYQIKKGDLDPMNEALPVEHRIIPVESFSITSVAFSSEAQYLICQIAAPEFTIIAWDWKRSRRIASMDVKMQASRLRFHPTDNAQISVSGDNYLRLWKLSERCIKPFPLTSGLDRSSNYVDHVWSYQDRLVAITQEGNIYVIKGCEVVQYIKGLHQGNPLLSITASKKEIIIGGKQGVLTILTKPENSLNTDFQLSLKINLNRKEDIIALSLEPSEESLLCSMKTCYGLYKLRKCFQQEGEEIETTDLSFYSTTTHSSAIQSISISSRKPLVASYCLETEISSSVFIWDYKLHTCVIAKRYQAPLVPTSISMHPSGLQILIAFSCHIELHHILSATLKLSMEIPLKGAKKVLFSPGGNLFAIVCGKLIHIYSTYGGYSISSPSSVGTFYGHTNDPFDLSWSYDDLTLYSCEENGVLYEWNMQMISDGEKKRKLNIKGIVISCLCIDQSGYLLFAVIDEENLSTRKFSSIYLWQKYENSCYLIANHILGCITQMVVSPHHKLYVGTDYGDILVYRWKGLIETIKGEEEKEKRINEGMKLVQSVVEQESTIEKGLFLYHSALHSSSITGLSLGIREGHLISCCLDGVLFISSVDSGDESHPSFLNSEENIIQIDKTHLEKEISIRADLTSTLEQMTIEKELTLVTLEANFKDNKKQWQKQIEELVTSKEKEKEDFLFNIKTLEKKNQEEKENAHHEYMKQIEHLDNLFQKELTKQKQSYQLLEKKYEDLSYLKETQSSNYEQNTYYTIKQIKEDHESYQNNLLKDKEELKESIETLKKNYEEIIRQEEKENEIKVLDLEKLLKQEKDLISEVRVESKGKLFKLERNILTLERKLSNKEDSIQQLIYENKGLKERIEELNGLILTLNEQIVTYTISIKDWERKTQEDLLSTKDIISQNVLYQHQIEELKQKIKPKEEHVNSIEKQLLDQTTYQEKEMERLVNLEYQLKEKTKKIEYLSNKIQHLKGENTLKTTFIEKFSKELDHIITQSDQTLWKNQLLKLYDDFVVKKPNIYNNVKIRQKEDNLTVEELLRHKKKMEIVIQCLKNKLNQDQEDIKSLKRNLLKENGMLIAEINLLRKKCGIDYRKDKKLLKEKEEKEYLIGKSLSSLKAIGSSDKEQNLLQLLYLEIKELKDKCNQQEKELARVYVELDHIEERDENEENEEELKQKDIVEQKILIEQKGSIEQKVSIEQKDSDKKRSILGKQKDLKDTAINPLNIKNSLFSSPDSINHHLANINNRKKTHLYQQPLKIAHIKRIPRPKSASLSCLKDDISKVNNFYLFNKDQH